MRAAVMYGTRNKDITFVEEADPMINDQIDVAYRTKYRSYAESIISHINGFDARAATIRHVPRFQDS